MDGHKRDDSLMSVEEISNTMGDGSQQKCNDSSEPHVGGENISNDKMPDEVMAGVVGNTTGDVSACSAKVKTNFILLLILQSHSFFNL